MNLPEFSVRHSMFGNMLTLFVIVGGLILLSTLRRDTFPEVQLDIVVVTTSYPNASPEEVENLVTSRIEEKIKEVEDVDEYTSQSVEGLSVITVKIDPEARHKERVISDIQRKVDQVDDLPADAETPVVAAATTRGPMIRVCVFGEADETELRRVGDALKARLERIPGVSSVEKNGWRDEEIRVEADLDRLLALDLSLQDIAQALAARNVNLPGGKINPDLREVVLRTLGQFYTPGEIADVPVRSGMDGQHVTVGDVATVTRTFEDDALSVRVNGQRAVILGVKKKESGDTIDIARAVKQVLEAERPRLPPGVSLTHVDDESFYVERRLKVLSSNGIFGFVFVVIVLCLFMNVRTALITGIGIPFAMLAALMIMAFYGVSINLITMFGLIIVLGMLVDDAVIVGENIFRHMEEGLSPRDAAIRGTTEVMYPVVSTVLTTVVAFIPLMFAPDLIGQVLRWFPIVVAITLAASLFEALLIMPCHVVDFMPAGRPGGDRKGKPRAHGIMKWTTEIYVRHLRRALRLRWLFIPVVLAVFGGLLVYGQRSVRVDIFPADLVDVFMLRMRAERGTPLAETGRLMGEIDRRIHQLPPGELENTVSFIGGHIAIEGGFKGRATHYASALIYLTPQNLRARRTQAVIDQLREDCRDIPGIENIEFEMIEPGPPTGKPLEVRLRGPEFATLQQISGEIQGFLGVIPGVEDIQDDFEAGKDELHVLVDPVEAGRLGVSVEAAARTVFAAFEGAEATAIREGDEEVKVKVMLDAASRDREESLSRLRVPNAAGRLVPLGRAARFERATGLPEIFHLDGERVVTVSASFAGEVSSVEVNQRLERAFQDLPERYPGYELIRGGEWKETRKLLLFMAKAFGVAVLCIFVILAVQFDSVLQPFVVMASIPLGMIGVVIALVLHDKPISIMATMGMVGMAGVVVNDAIVLVKFVNDLRRDEGVPVVEALVEAGRKRLRPILLTSFTTIAGLLPVIYGWGGYEPFVAPAAITLAYGLLFATFLTLMVVPCVYMAGVDMLGVVRFLRGSPGALARWGRGRFRPRS